ncbi:MAG: aspartate ammonia-lyase, partial [Methanobacterium sp.]
NEEHLRNVAANNPILATLLSPKIGYLEAAELARESMKTKQPVKDIALRKGILSKEEADELFDLRKISKNRYSK